MARMVFFLGFWHFCLYYDRTGQKWESDRGGCDRETQDAHSAAALYVGAAHKAIGADGQDVFLTGKCHEMFFNFNHNRKTCMSITRCFCSDTCYLLKLIYNKQTCLCPAGAPCLSFDVVRDGEGEGREQFPLSMILCAGTQADTALSNR